MMKVAIILSGNLRSFSMIPKGYDAKISDLFVKHLVSCNDADVFAFTDTNDFYHDGTVYFTNDEYRKDDIYKIDTISTDDAKDIINNQVSAIGDNLKYFHIENPFDITTDPKFNLLNNPNVGGCHPKQLLHQFRKLNLAYKAMKNYETKHNVYYDVIVKWRFDNSVTEDLDLSSYDFINHDVYTCGNHCPLIYDWHLFGNRKAMNHCLTIYDKLGSYLPEGKVYHCNGCINYGHKPDCCPDHNDSSDITLAAEYHLFRTIKDNKLNMSNSRYTGGCPYRYEEK